SDGVDNDIYVIDSLLLAAFKDIDGEYFSTLDDMVDKAEYLQTMGLYELIFNVRTKRTVSLKKQC
ncbi:unnamed protein product, partial [Didymodactylos carnosus]